MGRISANYEVIFVINPEIGDEAIAAAVEKTAALIEENGTVTEKSEWGKRRLAYPIEDFNEGYYVLINFTADSQFPVELERVFNITKDVIIRYLVVKK
jgi:small subunit ribosomal protein S6